MRESDIKHQDGHFWVSHKRGVFTVWRPGKGGPTMEGLSVSDSSYDDLSLAIYRCDYLAKRAKQA